MYVLIENNSVKTYPYTLNMLRKDNPQTSFPSHINDEQLADYGVYRVTFDEGADINPITHKSIGANTPILRNGEWVIESIVVAKTQAEIDSDNEQRAIAARLQRNELLKATDWYGLSDVTMPEDIATYRQALRDISSQEGFPHNIIWPEKPV